MTIRFRSVLAAAALTSLSGAALAHPGHAPASFATGFAHPLGGLDHLLAMLAVGLYAARQAGAARLLLPAGFVLAMLAGAGLGALGLALPAVEAGIAASVLVLGLLVAVQTRMPWPLAAALAGVFAFFHGAAHGYELAGGSALNSLAALAGMALGSATLHVAGMALGRAVLQRHQWLVRLAGGATATLGAFMLTRMA